MSNKILKTGLLSLTAATLLTTNAFATNTDVKIDKVTPEPVSYLDKTGKNSSKLFIINMSNTAGVDSILKHVYLDVNSTEANLTFLSNVKIYNGTRSNDKLVKSFPISDNDIEKSTGLSLDLDLSDVTNELAHIKPGENTTFILVVENNSIPQIEGKELNVTLKSLDYLYKANENDEGTLETLSIDSAKTDFKIDTTQPTITDVSLADDDGNSSYDYNSSFTVTINLSEHLDKDYSQSNTYMKELNASVQSSFSFKDADKTQFSIDKVEYNHGDSLSSNDTNDTTLTLTVNPQSPTVGDVTMTYSGSLLKDEAGNTLVNKTGITEYQVFDDTVDPTIEAVYISFEDTKKGKIVFSEKVKTENLSKLDIHGSKVSNGATNDYTVKLDSNSVTNSADSNQVIKTSVDFTLDKDVDLKNNFYVIINGRKSDFYKEALQDFGGNYVLTDKNSTTTDAYNKGYDVTKIIQEFSTKPINTTLVAGKWNLISIDNGLVTTSQKMFLTGTVQTIWGYENGTWVKSPKLIYAGKGYWVKALNETNSSDRNFSNTQATGYGATPIKLSSFIQDNSSSNWTLLGTPSKIEWSDAYKQVKNKCHTVSIYEYNASIGAWNVDSYIPALSGIWVKQENCN